MQASDVGSSTLHPALRAYLARHAIDPAGVRRGGRVTLTVDGTYRVHLQPAADGRLAITSVLLDLGLVAPDRLTDFLIRLAQGACALLREHAAGLAVDDAADRLVLQQLVAASVDLTELEAELAAFVNVLAFWVAAVAREAGPVQLP